MFDYKEWCRLCGSLDGTVEIQDDALLTMIHILEVNRVACNHVNNILTISLIFKISSDNMKLCVDCHAQLKQFYYFYVRAKSLDRLFTGLMQENEVDLSVKRLNAYRSHFNLESMLPETISHIESIIPDDQYGSFEFTAEEIEEKDDEEIVTEILDEAESSLIVQDEEFSIEEEVFMEEEVEDYITEDNITEDFNQQSQPRPQQKIFAKQRNLVTEKTEDEKLFTFQCHLCTQPEFLKMKLLALHCKEIHDCLPLVHCCSPDCEAVLSTWRRLLIHKEKHFPNDENLRCPECQKVYVTTAGFNKHMEKHNLRFVCSHCGKVFKETKTLQWHEQTHLKSLEDRRNHQCPYTECALKFITKQACENHIRMKHERIITQYCKFLDCDKSFFTKKAYYEHMRNTHTDRKFSCDLCSFKAKTRSALNTHGDVHRLGEEFSCDICNAAFSVYRRLKAHMGKLIVTT